MKSHGKSKAVLSAIIFEVNLLQSSRFGEALQSLQDQLNSKNFYQMNPSFDIGLTRESCDCQGECVQ